MSLNPVNVDRCRQAVKGDPVLTNNPVDINVEHATLVPGEWTEVANLVPPCIPRTAPPPTSQATSFAL